MYLFTVTPAFFIAIIPQDIPSNNDKTETCCVIIIPPASRRRVPFQSLPHNKITILFKKSHFFIRRFRPILGGKMTIGFFHFYRFFRNVMMWLPQQPQSYVLALYTCSYTNLISEYPALRSF